jgi:colicin import membrane protein
MEGIETHSSDRDTSFGIRLSVVAHLAFLLLIVVKNVIFPGKPLQYAPSLRVDIVGLPDQLKNERIRPALSPEISKALKDAEKTAKEMKPVVPKTPKTKEAAEPAEKDEMVLKPKQAKQDKAREEARSKKNKSALDRIKALSKISDEDAPAAGPATQIKGNKISKGTSLSGDARESAEASYFDQVRDSLQDNWALPVWVARQNLSAQVQIHIDPNGRVVKVRFVKPSGNTQFDEAVKKTINDSQPFAKPPRDISSSLLVNGILVGFPL